MPVARSRILAAALGALALLAASCWGGTRRLDELVFHAEPGLELKIVRWHENLPFHYTGEIHVVECRSEATRDSHEVGVQDAGWRMLGRGAALGTERAADLLPAVRERYRVLPGPTVLALGTTFRVSFDRCGRFATWDPTDLPPERIDPAPKPDFCAPEGTGDCPHMDFQGGERTPVYEAIEVDPARGHVAFTVRSAGLRGVSGLRVRSRDAGRTWTEEPLAAAPL